MRALQNCKYQIYRTGPPRTHTQLDEAAIAFKVTHLSSGSLLPFSHLASRSSLSDPHSLSDYSNAHFRTTQQDGALVHRHYELWITRRHDSFVKDRNSGGTYPIWLYGAILR